MDAGQIRMRLGRARQAFAIEVCNLADAFDEGAADQGFDVICHGDTPGNGFRFHATGLAQPLSNVYDVNMANKDNSVNMKGGRAKPTRTYHHGDLRAAVIVAGLARLRNDGGELGLRALARDVGVSATALYRHFPDKEALLDALAEEGLRRLGAVQAQAWLKAGGSVAGFKATGIAYVRFAHEEPALFRLSFTRQMADRSDGGDGGDVAYNLLRAGVEEALPGGDDPDAAALHVWALVHGLAMLVLDGRIRWDQAMIEKVVRLTFGGVD